MFTAKTTSPFTDAEKGSQTGELSANQRKMRLFAAIGVGALLLITILVLIGSYAFKGQPAPVVPVPVVHQNAGSGPSPTQPILDILMEDPILALNISLKRHFAVTVSVLAVTALLVIFVISMIIYVSVVPAHIEPEPEPEPEVIDKDDMSFWELFSEDPLAALMRPIVAIPSVLVISTLIGILVYVFVFRGKHTPLPRDLMSEYRDRIRTIYSSLRQTGQNQIFISMKWKEYEFKEGKDTNGLFIKGLTMRIKWLGNNVPAKQYMLDFIKYSPCNRTIIVPLGFSDIDENIETNNGFVFEAINIDNGLSAYSENQLEKMHRFMMALQNMN